MSELAINNKSTELTVDSHAASIDGVTPDDVKDYGVSLPGLKLVHAMSREGKDDPQLIGKLLYDGRLDLGHELDTIILSSQWRWAEKRPYDANNTTPPNIMTNDAFVESGLEKDQVTRLCIINLAAVLPDGVEDGASVSAGGREYVLCSLWARGFSIDFAKAVARRVNSDYEGATYNKVTKLQAGVRVWKGEKMRVLKWAGAGPKVSAETLSALAEEVGGLG